VRSILERVERALWAAFDAEQGDEKPDDEDDPPPKSPSPIQELTDLMERRSKTLGVQPAASAELGRTDGFRNIAEALRDLAQPSGMPADELERWLESVGLMGIGEVVGQARGADASVRRVMTDLWDQVFVDLPVVQVAGKAGALRVDDDAIFKSAGATFLLERVADGDRVSLQRIRVRVGERDEDDDTVEIEDPTDRLAPGASVHTTERSEGFLVELYQKLGAFHDDLVRAPRMIQDVRVLVRS